MQPRPISGELQFLCAIAHPLVLPIQTIKGNRVASCGTGRARAKVSYGSLTTAGWVSSCLSVSCVLLLCLSINWGPLIRVNSHATSQLLIPPICDIFPF